MKERTFVLFMLLFGCLSALLIWFFYQKATKTSLPSNFALQTKSYSVAAVGDLFCSPEAKTTPTTCQTTAVVKAIDSANPDAVLLLGDLQYEKGEPKNFSSIFAPAWETLRSKSFPSPGNHEYLTVGANGYFGYWGERAGSPASGYYSFKLGNWQIISLNSNCEEVGGCEASSPQGQWLLSELEQNKSKCTLAFWHHPRFNSGGHRADLVAAARSEYFWQALQAAETELVLNGHDHNYERFTPQTTDGQPSAQGIRQFVVGTGGKSMYKLTTPFVPNHEKGIDDTFGYLQLELREAAYSWKFIATDGTIRDQGRGACQ